MGFSRSAIITAYLLVFWVFLPLLLLVPHILWSGTDVTVQSITGGLVVRLVPAVLITAAGLRLLVPAMLGLVRHGKGLPISHLPPHALVAGGVYAICRHPIYVGYVLVWIGVAVLLASVPLAFVSVPTLILASAGYAFWEERGLVRRHGERYEQYRRDVPFIPLTIATIVRLLSVPVFAVAFHFRSRRVCPAGPSDEHPYDYVFTSGVGGSGPIPTGGYVVIAPHNNYLDPLFVTRALRRSVRFLTTHDMFRSSRQARLFAGAGSIRFDRFRSNPAAVREIIRTVGAGGCVGVFPDGGRSWFGDGIIQEELIKLVVRYRLPVVPVALEGAYSAWPRWGKLHRMPVRALVFAPRTFTDPQAVISTMRKLRRHTFADPKATSAVAGDGKGNRQAIGTRILPVDGIGTILYRCPACGGLETITGTGRLLRCTACGGRWHLTCSGGLLNADDGADRADPIWLPHHHDRQRQQIGDGRVPHPATVDWWVEFGDSDRDQMMGRVQLALTAVGLELSRTQMSGSPLHQLDLAGTEERQPERTSTTTRQVTIPYRTILAVLIRGNSVLQVYHQSAAGERPLLYSFRVLDGRAFVFQEYLRERCFGSARIRKRGDTVATYA